MKVKEADWLNLLDFQPTQDPSEAFTVKFFSDQKEDEKIK